MLEDSAGGVNNVRRIKKAGKALDQVGEQRLSTMIQSWKRRPTTKRRGLTLGEMLIVLAVFLVLATMFLMSSQFAIVKTKTSKVIHDQREIVKALYQYTGDYLTVPGEGEGLSALLRNTRGTTYMSRLPIDPFAEQVGTLPPVFQYYADIAPKYESLVVSVGPDGDLDVEPVIQQMRKDSSPGLAARTTRMLFKTPDEAHEFIAVHSYDPTNGSVSDGDIIQHFGY